MWPMPPSNEEVCFEVYVEIYASVLDVSVQFNREHMSCQALDWLKSSNKEI